MIKKKFDCSKERIASVLSAVGRRYSGEKVDSRDGVRVDFADGWVHVRGSNTEPIIRIIAEATDPRRAESLITEIQQLVPA
jgi:phosphomannomutase